MLATLVGIQGGWLVSVDLTTHSLAATIANPLLLNADMDAEAVRSVIQQAADSWSQGNAKAFADLFAPDGEFIVPGQRHIGAAAIERVAAEFAQTHEQVRVMVKRTIIDGAQAVVEWRWEEVETSTGQHSVADDAIVVDFANGRIQRWREYIDAQTPA